MAQRELAFIRRAAIELQRHQRGQAEHGQAAEGAPTPGRFVGRLRASSAGCGVLACRGASLRQHVLAQRSAGPGRIVLVGLVVALEKLVLWLHAHTSRVWRRRSRA